jgi:hypothetical protein
VKKGYYETHLCLVGNYKPGDPPPEGYMEWFAWADVQLKAGLKQTPCRKCRLWFFPNETHQCGRIKE